MRPEMITVGRMPTGGTYTTTTTDEDTGESILMTWDYNKTMLDQPISETREFIQQREVKPGAHPRQIAGAKVLRLETEFMDYVHNHESILSKWQEAVGSVQVDTVVGTGVSGTIACVNLARDLGINYLIVRKDAESAHSRYAAEGRLGKNWVFVDDCVSTGATFSRVWDTVSRLTQRGFNTTYRGAFLYQDWEHDEIVPPRDRVHHRWLRDGKSKTFGTPTKELAAW